MASTYINNDYINIVILYINSTKFMVDIKHKKHSNAENADLYKVTLKK